MWRFHIVLRFAAVALVFAISSNLWAQEGIDPSIPPDTVTRIHMFSALSSPTRDETDNILGALEFPETARAPGWSHFSPVRKIEHAYLLAESHHHGNGGVFLESFRRYLANEYSSAGEPGTLDPIDFAQRILTPAPEVPQAEKNLILRLSSLCQSGIFGDVPGIMLRDFELTPNQVYEILRSSESTDSAFLTAYSRVPQARRAFVLRSWVSDLARQYSTIRGDPTFAQFLHRDQFGVRRPRPWPERSPTPPQRRVLGAVGTNTDHVYDECMHLRTRVGTVGLFRWFMERGLLELHFR